MFFAELVIKARLVIVDVPAMDEVIQIAERPAVDLDGQQLNLATCKRSLHQAIVKLLEVRAGERTGFAARDPIGLMQRLECCQTGGCRVRIGCGAHGDDTQFLVLAPAAADMRASLRAQQLEIAAACANRRQVDLVIGLSQDARPKAARAGR